ncbi:hypothetical protein SLEP1_g39559 [Rubroshorea leprosula]|uniref:Uncharacterized protein n=1 Tax=Rubroshorea leprosula TaxID=152421 RepID=A0AAV5L0T0_9ROSI|nr:hypothetical protein SLEP1_g39559 [Rubroshorea leprosula]
MPKPHRFQPIYRNHNFISSRVISIVQHHPHRQVGTGIWEKRARSIN